MRKVPSAKAMLVIGAVVAAMAAGPASALVGHDPSGGSDRGGRESSALVGLDKFRPYDGGDYEFSALFGTDLSGSAERGDYRFSS